MKVLKQNKQIESVLKTLSHLINRYCSYKWRNCVLVFCKNCLCGFRDRFYFFQVIFNSPQECYFRDNADSLCFNSIVNDKKSLYIKQNITKYLFLPLNHAKQYKMIRTSRMKSLNLPPQNCITKRWKNWERGTETGEVYWENECLPMFECMNKNITFAWDPTGIW